MQGIHPLLWFDNQAEAAMAFSTTICPNSRILETMPGPDGKVLTGTFELNGQQCMVLNGGPRFRFTEAVSLFVSRDTREEVDNPWVKLTAGGGEESMCGWLKDTYGRSWQIIPTALERLMGDPDREKAGRVMQAMLHMRKIGGPALERAYNGT